MKKGIALNSKSTIGIVAPSSPSELDVINEKIEAFKSLGFNVKLGSHLYDKSYYLAGDDKARADDINSMFKDPSIDGILCYRGGYGSSRIIQYLDKKIIKNNPKFFCGYSDITLLLNYFNSLGLITFHGPMINSNFEDNETRESFLKVLSCNKRNFTYDLPSISNKFFTHNIRNFKGKLVGGNLTLLSSSIGTEYEINTTNSILLIEEVNESPYSVDRMITHLKNCGKFRSVKGILLGDFTNCSSLEEGQEIYSLLIELLSPLNIPIISGLPFGHNYPNITIPIGVVASFNAFSNTLTIEDNFLR